MSNAIRSHQRPFGKPHRHHKTSEQRERRDRWAAVAVVVAMAALIALFLWLVGYSDGTPIETDYWPMMP